MNCVSDPLLPKRNQQPRESWWRQALSVARLAALALVVGCGGDGIERVEVAGQVTYRGKPVEDGFISFEPIGNGIQSGAKITQGAYQAVDRGAVPVGKYTVRISWLKEDKSKQVDGMPVPPQVNLLPAKYNTASELTLDVPSGQGSMQKDFLLD